jgi:hypothetical protein
MDFLDAPEDEMCRALEVEFDGRFSCGLAKRPLHYINPGLVEHSDAFEELTRMSELITKYLGFGDGCGMDD